MKEFWTDTETTGLIPGRHAVIQIAGIIIVDGEEMEEVNLKLQPYRNEKGLRPNDEIDDKALQVNGLTREQLFSEDRLEPSRGYAELMHILGQFVDKYNPKDKMLFHAFNARFDADFIRQFMVKNNDNYFGSWFWFPPIDVMQWASLLLMGERDQMNRFTLKECCEYVGLEWDDDAAHEAMYDIRMTMKLGAELKRIMNQGDKL